MKNSQNFVSFGENVEGFDVPVLNEREIRAAAGILFVCMLIALMFILFRGDFLFIKYLITVFLADLLVRVFISPGFSPTLILGRLIVSRQKPEYTGAAQKKFAWKIGIMLAGLMFILLVVVNAYSIFTGLTCLICLTFLFFESAFGICLGCIAYSWFYKNKKQLCAGEICEPSKKQEIQKTSGKQLLILLGLVAFVILIFIFFNAQFSDKPKNLWDILK